MFDRIAKRRKTSEQAHCTARNLILPASSPPGKKVPKTDNSASMKFVVPTVLLATNEVQAVEAQ